jgi:hypothetical protein
MRDIKLTFDNRGLFLAQYPKPKDFKSEVISAIKERSPLPRVNESLKDSEDVLRIFPELVGLSDFFIDGAPRRLDIRINREAGVINVKGNQEDGADISMTSSVNYANNSGTYESFDGRDLESIKFIVTKQNVANATTFFVTNMDVSDVDENGAITELSFDGLTSNFAQSVFGGNKPTLEGVNADYMTGSRPIIWGDNRVDMIGLDPTPIDFEIPEPYEGEYYIQPEEDVLVKLDVVKNTTTENIEGLELTVDRIDSFMGFNVTSTVEDDYTGVSELRNYLIINDYGRFKINGLYVQNNETQEWLFFDVEASGSIIKSNGITWFNINISLSTKVLPFFEGDKIFITFDTTEEYDGTPQLNTINVTTNSFEIDGYEIINGGEGYAVKSFGKVSVSEGFKIGIVHEILTDGTWSIPQEEIVEGFFYSIIFNSGEISFSGLFKREGDRFRSVERVESDLIFSAINVFEQPIMGAGKNEGSEPAYITDSAVSRFSRIRRPDSFLLEKVILTRSNNTSIGVKNEFASDIYVDNFNHKIYTIDSGIAMQLATNPSDCLQCVRGIAQSIDFSQVAMSELESGEKLIHDALAVTAQDSGSTNYDLIIVKELVSE